VRQKAAGTVTGTADSENKTHGRFWHSSFHLQHDMQARYDGAIRTSDASAVYKSVPWSEFMLKLQIEGSSG
jgi:hypothetical protein